MRILSVKQPWASFICAGLKDIENRSKNTPYRGVVAIHAGQNQALLKAAAQHVKFNASDFPLGKIIGLVDLVDATPLNASLESNRWAMGKYCWKLANPRMLAKPITHTGQLGLMYAFTGGSTRLARCDLC